MCGIAGVLDGEGSAAAMIAALAHRGPDGIRIEAEAGRELAHARLSIIDLAGGWQPLHAAGGSVVGNGEIYNYIELAEEFGLADRLATGSDFEPLLHLYAREGPAAFARLRGMYAFCLVGNDGRAWLVRDPFGIKPLYVARCGGGVAFASEPRAFFAAGLVRPVLAEPAARELLALNYSLGEATVFEGVRRLAPGAIVEVKAGELIEYGRRGALQGPGPVPSPLAGEGGPAEQGRMRGHAGVAAASRVSTNPASPEEPVAQGGFHQPRRGPSSDIPSGGHLLPRGEKDLLRRLDTVLEDSVRVHQRSDVPYGLFLSGGVDSAAIATLMARSNDRPVTAFTCGFDAPGAADERRLAERVARALDLDWRETHFDAADFWRLLPQAAWALDDPTADYAVLPTLKLAEAAKGTLTVVLTGEGGDELFGGYGRYRRALRPAWLGGRAAEPRPEDPQVLARWRDAARAPPGLTRLQQAQWADVATWLPGDLLTKLDRCLMAHGLEGRTPFLDAEVAAFAFALPDRFKVRGRHGKWLLRAWLARTCPAAAPWAHKQGFTVPVDAWIAPRGAEIARRVAKVAAVRRLSTPEAVAAAFARPGGGWPLLFFAVWSLIHLEGASPEAALAAAAGPI